MFCQITDEVAFVGEEGRGVIFCLGFVVALNFASQVWIELTIVWFRFLY